jgi:hypothetical protein
LLKNFSDQFSLADLNGVYYKIKTDYLNELNAEVGINNSKLFNTLGEKFLKSNSILEIVTRHKPDK